jgi:hypothetical protein
MTFPSCLEDNPVSLHADLSHVSSPLGGSSSLFATYSTERAVCARTLQHTSALSTWMTLDTHTSRDAGARAHGTYTRTRHSRAQPTARGPAHDARRSARMGDVVSTRPGLSCSFGAAYTCENGVPACSMYVDGACERAAGRSVRSGCPRVRCYARIKARHGAASGTHHVAIILGKRAEQLLALPHARAGFRQLLLNLCELRLLLHLRRGSDARDARARERRRSGLAQWEGGGWRARRGGRASTRVWARRAEPSVKNSSPYLRAIDVFCAMSASISLSSASSTTLREASVFSTCSKCSP